jgi:hypothetical protein
MDAQTVPAFSACVFAGQPFPQNFPGRVAFGALLVYVRTLRLLGQPMKLPRCLIDRSLDRGLSAK